MLLLMLALLDEVPVDKAAVLLVSDDDEDPGGAVMELCSALIT